MKKHKKQNLAYSEVETCYMAANRIEIWIDTPWSRIPWPNSHVHPWSRTRTTPFDPVSSMSEKSNLLFQAEALAFV